MTVDGDDAVLETIEHFRQRRRLSSIDPGHLDLVIDEISLAGREPVDYVSGSVSYTHLTLPTTPIV